MRHYLFLLCLFASYLPLFALDPTLRISQYQKRTWRIEDGLPENYVTSLLQSSAGDLIVGTSGGAVRFDGLHFSPIVLDPSSGITREWITALSESPPGSLWISTRDAGLFEISKRGAVRSPDLSAAFDSTAGNFGFRAGLYRYSGRWQSVAPIQNTDLSWQGLALLPDGSVLAATSDGVVRVHNQSVELIIPAASVRGRPLSFAPRRAGGFWLGSTGGLFVLPPNDLQHPQRVLDIPGPVVSVAEDADGLIWAATWGLGLYRVSAGSAVHCTSDDGLPDDFIHALLIDSDGALWIATRGGLSRWTTPLAVPYGPDEGLSALFVSTVTPSRHDTAWFGSWRSGLYELTRAGFRKEPIPIPDLETTIRSAAQTPRDELLISTIQGVFRRSPSGVWSKEPDDPSFPGFILAMLTDRAGQFWVGGVSGLMQYPRGQVAPNGFHRLQGAVVHALVEDPSGPIWAATSSGLYQLTNQSTRRITGLPHPYVTSVTLDSRGRIWGTTKANGIFLVEAGVVHRFDESHGLPPIAFFTLLDGGDSLWMTSPAGIYRLPFEQFDLLLSQRIPRLQPILFNEMDGMRTRECQNTSQPAAWRSSSGDLWFLTVRGAVCIRPSMLKPRSGLHVFIQPPANSRRLFTVRYSADLISAPHRVEFRYLLPALSSDWISAGTERTIQLSNLPAGNHELTIQAREWGGPWGPSSLVELQQPPRLYETWWFRLITLACLTSLLFLAYHWRVYSLRTRYAAVLEERNRISREWHDTLLAGFSAISWQLDATLKSLAADPGRAASSVDTARRMVHHYRAEARRVIWDLRDSQPESARLEDLAAAALRQAAEGHGLRTQFILRGHPVPLDPDRRLNALRICQEAIANAIRHANPSELSLQIEFQPHLLQLRVEDDGAGFDPAPHFHHPSGHFGLTVMRERARRFKGDLRIVSTPGSGTIVEAEIPLTNQPQ